MATVISRRLPENLPSILSVQYEQTNYLEGH